jgi:hypothetical protein
MCTNQLNSYMGVGKIGVTNEVMVLFFDSPKVTSRYNIAGMVLS